MGRESTSHVYRREKKQLTVSKAPPGDEDQRRHIF
jgi:hypothetical protein